MTSLAEAIGMTLPGCANIPAPDARRMAIAELSGRRIVEMIDADLRPSRIMTRAAFENAVTMLMALGGSTNAVIHLIAIAGRLGIPLTLADFDRISRRTPCIVNVKPSGEFLMEDLFNAGGVPAVMNRVADLLDGECLTVNGKTIGENIAAAAAQNDAVIRPRATPLDAEGGIAILYGNLAPDGAVIKQTAASPHLLAHRGRALVFENREEMQARIDSDDLPVDRDTVLVMRSCGPKGAPGMPEWGQIPMPKKLLNQGVTDMVRISDARMSGTSFGTVVLHVAPESAIGGPLAAVRTGDEIELGRSRAQVGTCVPADEIAARLRAVSNAQAALHARVRAVIPRSRHAGESGMRLRFPHGLSSGACGTSRTNSRRELNAAIETNHIPPVKSPEPSTEMPNQIRPRKPPRLPNELISPMLAAAAVGPRKLLGIDHSGGKPAKIPASASARSAQSGRHAHG